MDLKKEIHKYIEFIKFNMVGIANFIVDFIIFIKSVYKKRHL